MLKAKTGFNNGLTASRKNTNTEHEHSKGYENTKHDRMACCLLETSSSFMASMEDVCIHCHCLHALCSDMNHDAFAMCLPRLHTSVW